MLVREAMTHKIKTLTQASTLREAIQIFHDLKIGIIPVVDENNRLLGAFSRSLLYRALLEDFPLNEKIESLFLRDVITVFENERLIESTKVLKEHQIANTIVVSEKNDVLGILSQADINRSSRLGFDAFGDTINSLLRHMHTGALAIDHEGLISVMNSAAETMCGRSCETSIGMPLENIFPDLHDILSSLEFTTEKFVLRHVTINEKKLLVTCNILSAYDYSWAGLILIQELTEYETIADELEITKRLEQTLQTITESSNDGYILIDHKGTIRLANKHACEVFNTTQKALLNQPVQEQIPEMRLETALTGEFTGEQIEAVKIGKTQCLIGKIPLVYKDQVVGAVGNIRYRNLNNWKNVMKRLDSLEKEVSYYRTELSKFNGTEFDLEDIISQNKSMSELKQFARQVANGFSNILLLGESGTGKELFARGIHNSSNRRGKFVKINCAAVPSDLWESEFFGYADGAFTGAKRGGKIGRFEQANNGTLFLDEIGDMPLSMQVKLLRVLQEREFERVGGTETINVNVRIVAATNKNLEEMVALGEFREDLYYRLNVIAIQIPSLINRIEDIPLLANSICKKFSHLMGIDNITISPEVMKKLKAYKWPGNVRELENIIERAMNCLYGKVIELKHLPEHIRNIDEIDEVSEIQIQSNLGQESKEVLKTNSTTIQYKQKINDAEKEAIESALQLANGNRTEAAKLLGISRSQFYKKMNLYCKA
ncbi:sigma-54-dependent Fis family transcriptional regulator [Bacillus sp. AFS017336]|uniref:sigma-54-dependent Fis family transcriptional regulator n=1 Tax=Bacillus sp. AFS017336 TaxID=2033489 RepID=UPI000BEF449D|nr:sigma-54-dependent Fis family transcriptional regulator [Bacillus sp. AFS017336]PEL14241.1 hypothetical protein CN601_01470 [Bacillus sp. AFS017336]